MTGSPTVQSRQEKQDDDGFDDNTAKSQPTAKCDSFLIYTLSHR